MYLTKAPTGGQAWKSFCDHCGNITFQHILAIEVVRKGDIASTFTFARCTICDGIILRKHPGDWNAPVHMGESTRPVDEGAEQLWPPALGLTSEVPDRIRSIYDEARLVKKQSPSSFVVQIRRAFEAVASDMDAEGRTLHAQIQTMITDGRLPSVFAEMTNIARMIGNLGAHDAERDVTPVEASASDDFFRAVVEYLYIAPALVSKARSEFDR